MSADLRPRWTGSLRQTAPVYLSEPETNWKSSINTIVHQNTITNLIGASETRQKQLFTDVFQYRFSLKIPNIHKKAPVLESIFGTASLLKVQ